MKRQYRYGTNSTVFVLVVVAILGVANWILSRHTKKWDLTADKRFSLSEQTKKVLGNLPADVKILYFQNWMDPATRRSAEGRLQEYVDLSPKIKVEYVDHRKEPRRATQYDVTMVPTLVLTMGERFEKISNDSEQEITNAVIKLTRTGKKTVCFAEGEGERDPDDAGQRGLSEVKGGLTRAQYATKKVPLLGAKEVPADCTVLVVAGPQKDLQPQEVELVRAWVAAGGKLLAMVEPDAKDSYPNLVALLKGFNLNAGPGMVVDLYGEIAGIGAAAPIGRKYEYHDITKDFQLATAFLTARPVEAGQKPIDGVTAQNLVSTSPEASDPRGNVVTWVESDVTSQHAKYDEGPDRKGPVPLGAVATIRVGPAVPPPMPGAPPPPESEKKAEGRVVAFGDVDFASNSLLAFPGNLDFTLNAIAWLAQDVDLISIRPKDPQDQRLVLEPRQRLLVAAMALLLVPGAFVAAGIWSWWSRR